MSTIPEHSSAVAFREGPWPPIRDFGIHSFVGTSVFTVIATPAIGCDFAVKWLEHQQVSSYIIYGLHGAEISLFVCDLALLIVFLLKTSIRHAGRL